MNIPIEISARHVHLSRKDLDKLFHPGYELTKIKDLSQPGEFACKEMIQIIGKNFSGNRIRIIGPSRKETQVEISRTDALRMDLQTVPLRLSGDLKGAPKVKITGPSGQIIQVKVIVAKRHLHCSPQQAKKLKIKNDQKLKIRITGDRALTFENIIVRVGDKHKLALHIDTDEGNAAGLGRAKKTKAFGKIVK